MRFGAYELFMGFRYLLRRLARTPGFTAVAIITLALGIGANTAIFSVMEAVILRPLHYPQPDRLIALDHAAPGAKLSNTNGAPFLYYAYKEDARSFDAVSFYNPDTLNITGGGQPERVDILLATHDLWPLLGVRPMLGRAIGEAEDKPQAARTVMLSWGYWQSHFGGAPDVIGKRIIGDGEQREIIGVLPRGFRFLDLKADLYLPFRRDRSKIFLGQFGTPLIARLKPGVTLQQAAAEARTLIPLALHKFPPAPGASQAMFDQVGLTPVFQSLHESLVGDSRRFLWILMGTIAIVLLIACANVANLMLVRADGRRQELAVRIALGAGTGRIALDLMTESLALAVAGGIAGIALAAAALRMLVAWGPSNVPRLDEVSLDTPVLLFCLGITLLSGLGFGALPALRYAGRGLAGGLRGGGRNASESRERHYARSVLVVVQVALALVLAIGAGLMVRTFSALREVEPGFTKPGEIQTFRIAIPEGAVKDNTQAIHMANDILDRVKATPGVQSAALYSTLPMTNSGWNDPLWAEGRTYAEGQIPPLSRFRFVSPGVPAAMGMKMLAGRDFSWADVYDKHSAVLVNATFAREYWNTVGAAVGKRIRGDPNSPWREVVGVVGDERSDGLAKPAPRATFFPILAADFQGNSLFAFREPYVVVRSPRAGSLALMDDLRKAVWSVNPNLPLADVRTMQLLYDRSAARTSFTLVMLALAGSMALLLGLVGVYGVIAYSVARRTREIGIRAALGAQPAHLIRTFAAQGLQLAAIGVLCGAIAAYPLTRFLQSLLYQVSPADPLTWIVVIPALFLAAALASWIPARRTVRVDPTEALRSE